MKKRLKVLLSFTLSLSLFSNVSAGAMPVSSTNDLNNENEVVYAETSTEELNADTENIDTEILNDDLRNTESVEDVEKASTDIKNTDILSGEEKDIDDVISYNNTLIVSTNTELDKGITADEITNYDDTWILSYSSSEDAQNVLNELKNQSYVNYIEEDNDIEIDGNASDNKAYYNFNDGNVLVAIIDTGVNNAENNIDLTGEGTEDLNGHGTSMANQIEESANDTAKILSIKAIGENGKGTISNVFKGIACAIENNADIINISLSTADIEKSQCLSSIIDKATEEGIKVVVSAGNKSNDTINYSPANCESAIVVSAVETDGTFSSYSNYGDTVDYSAIGTTKYGSGTSIAAAYVSGLLCLGDLSNGIDLGEAGWDKYYGNCTFGVNINNENDDNENDADNIKKDDSIVSKEENLKIDSLDNFDNWQNMTDEELDDVLSSNSDEICALFWQNLSSAEKENILSRNTCLNGIHIYYDSTSDDADGYNLTGQHEEVFYKYLENYNVSSVVIQDGEVVSSTGYYYIAFSGNATSASSKYKIKITISVSNTNTQTTPTISIDTSYSGYKNNQNLKINKVYKTQHGATNTLTDSKKQEAGKDEDGNTVYSTVGYPILAIRYSYTKPAYSYAKQTKAYSYTGARFNTRYCFSDDIGVLGSSPSSGATKNFYWNTNELANVSDSYFSVNNKGVNKSSCTEYFYMQVNMNQTGITYCGAANSSTVHNTLTINLNYPTLTIKYNVNNGTSGSDATKDIDSVNTTIIYDGSTKKNLYNKSVFDLSRTGYHINSGEEWYISGGDTYNEDTDYLATQFKDFTNGTIFSAYSVTVKARWAINVATIQYNTNGGTIKTSNSTNTSNVYYNDSANVWYKTNSTNKIYASTISVTSGFTIKTSTIKYNASSIDLINVASFGLTKTGYHISSDEAWLVGSINGKTLTQSETTNATDIAKITSYIKNNNSTIDIYANWQANQYSIVYNANKGSGTMSATSCTYDASTTLRANTYTRTGYSFLGWNTKADGSGTSYSDKQSVSNLTSTNNGTITLYAQWKPNSYSIIYNSNGGTGRMTNTNSAYDVETTLQANTFTRSGLYFIGWNEKPDGSGAGYDDCEIVKNLTSTNNGTVILYAQWNNAPYVVTFDGNGGTPKYTTRTVVYNTHNWYLGANSATRTGYNLEGWYDKNGIEVYDANGNYVANTKYWDSNGFWIYPNNITVYAKWSPYQHTIKYDSNGGINSPNNQTKIYGSTLSISSDIPIRAGYTFANWNTQKDGSGQSYQPGEEYDFDQNGGTVVLYAQWNLNPITITIPRKLILGSDGNCSFKITADNQIGIVKINASQNIEFYQENKNEKLIGNVSLNTTELTSQCHEAYGFITVDDVSAGNWKATMYLDIAFSLKE